jgi:UPF0716 protein FxsA
MQILLFLLFIAVPIAEITLFIEAGRLIGVIPTILLTIGTAVAGTLLMRVQGLATLNRIAQSLEKGETPVGPVLDGMGIFLAGILLVTPGFLTDAIGLLLFVPPIRRGIGKWIFSRLARGGQLRFSTYGASSPEEPQGGRPAGGGFKKADDVVDAEFETIDPDETDPKAPHPERLDGKGRADRKSPWRRR